MNNKEKDTLNTELSVKIDYADLRTMLIEQTRNAARNQVSALFDRHFQSEVKTGIERYDRPPGPGTLALKAFFQETMASEKMHNIMTLELERQISADYARLVESRLRTLVQRCANRDAWNLFKANSRITEEQIQHLLNKKTDE